MEPVRLFCPWDFRARILEWVVIPFSRGSSRPRDHIHVSCIAGRFFTSETLGKPYPRINKTGPRAAEVLWQWLSGSVAEPRRTLGASGREGAGLHCAE